MARLNGPLEDIQKVLGKNLDWSAAAQTMITKVDVESAYGPRYVLEDPFGPGPPNPLLKILRPKISLYSIAGAPVVIAPYGEPGTSRWPNVRLGLAVGGAVVAGLFVGGLLRSPALALGGGVLGAIGMWRLTKT